MRSPVCEKGQKGEAYIPGSLVPQEFGNESLEPAKNHLMMLRTLSAGRQTGPAHHEMAQVNLWNFQKDSHISGPPARDFPALEPVFIAGRRAAVVNTGSYTRVYNRTSLKRLLHRLRLFPRYSGFSSFSSHTIAARRSPRMFQTSRGSFFQAYFPVAGSIEIRARNAPLVTDHGKIASTKIRF